MQLRFKPWWLVSAVALAVTANAGQPATTEALQNRADTGTATAEFNGMKVAIDRKTGKLRPLTQEESQELESMLTQQRRATPQGRSSAAMAPATEADAMASARRLPNGATAIKLPQSQMEYVTATQDADGKLVLRHSSDDAAAQELSHE